MCNFNEYYYNLDYNTKSNIIFVTYLIDCIFSENVISKRNIPLYIRAIIDSKDMSQLEGWLM